MWHETQVSGPTFEEAQLPFVTPSATTPGKSEAAWRFFFRLVGSGSAQARAAAAFIAEHLEASTVAVIDDSSPEYGKPLADVVAEALGQYDVAVVHRASLVPGRDDYSTEVANIVNSEAEAVFFGGYSREAGLVKRQLVATGGSSIPFISGDAVFDAQYLETAGPENAESTYVTFPGVDPSSAAPEFIQAYRDEYGVQPGPFTLEAHDAARLIIEGLRWGACDRSAMRSFLASYNGEIRGRDISFDEMGNLEDPRFTVYAVADGTWTLEVQRQPASLPGPPIASTTSPERSP